MINVLKPYPAMKDSGVEWLGNIPEHWKVLPGRVCYREKKNPNTGLKEKTILSLSYGRIVVKSAEKLHGLVPVSFETYQIVEPWDIIIRPTDLQNDWNSLRFGLSRNYGIITSAYMCFCTQTVLNRSFGHLLLHTYDLKKVFYGLGSGLRQNLDWGDFKYLPCLVPSTEEQVAIVRFLYYMDRRIRKYIRVKQKMIKLLEEQKQAIINHAVTRGLNPNARLKPSGVNWLGNIPEHWEVMNLRRVCKVVKTGSTPSGAEEKYYTAEGYNWYTPSDFKQTLYLQGSERQLSELGISNVRLFSKGTVMMIGIGATIGKVSVTNTDASCNQQINAMVVNDRVFNEYFAYYLRSLKNYIVMCGKYTTLPIINQDETKSLAILIPPVDEQHIIAIYINSELNILDNTIIMDESSICLIREYHTRLIADVVTGKLDVREVAKQLPDEIDEPEPIDEESVPKEESVESEDSENDAIQEVDQ